MDAAANRRRLEPSCGDATLSRLHGDPTLSRLHERFGILVTLPTAGEHLVNAAELQALAATYGVVVLRNTANTPMAPQQIAAVCDQPGTVHYIGKGYTAGVAEFMPSTFLHRWYPSVERALSKVGDRWEKVDFKALRPPSTEVPCVSLSHILDTELRLRWIDFAILDTEGAELSILKTVDWQRIHFGVLVIEDVASTRPISYRKDIIDYMLNHTGGQYKVIFSVRGRNTWFMHRDFVATAQAPREDPTSRSGSFYRWSAPYM